LLQTQRSPRDCRPLPAMQAKGQAA